MDRLLIEKLFVEISKLDGQKFVENNAGDFVDYIYKKVGLSLPDLNNIIFKDIVGWKNLHTGDIALYTNSKNKIWAVVLGECNRTVCYSDPNTSIVKIEDYDIFLCDCNYSNGLKL